MRDTFNGKKDKIVASIPANPKENNVILRTDKSNVNPNSMTLKMNSEINIVIDKERKEKRINGTFFLFSPGLRKEKKHFFSAGFSSETMSYDTYWMCLGIQIIFCIAVVVLFIAFNRQRKTA